MRILNYTYPYISLAFIEWGNIINQTSNFLTFGIFCLQGLIGLLTIVKLWKDIKGNHFISTEKTKKSVEKKYPFLTNLFKYLKK